MNSFVSPLSNVDKKEAKLVFDLMLEKDEFTHISNYGKSLIAFIEGKFEQCDEYLQKAVTQGQTNKDSRIDDVMAQIVELQKKKNPPPVNILEELNKRSDGIKLIPFVFNASPDTRNTSLPSFHTTLLPVRQPPARAAATVERRDFFCIICYKRFTKMFSLNRHMMIHSGTKNHRCNLCNRAFIQKTDLERHQATHKSTRDVECSYLGCQKRFKTKKNMKSHRIIHFPFVRPFTCKHCEQTFNRPRALQHHVTSHDEKKYLCDICGKRFGVKSYIRSHMRVHEEAKPFKCPSCISIFKRHYDMRFHFKNQHRDAFEAGFGSIRAIDGIKKEPE